MEISKQLNHLDIKIKLIFVLIELAQLFGAFLNFYKDMHFLNYYNISLIIMKSSLRLFDIEQSYKYFGAYSWQILVFFQSANVVMCLNVQFNFCLMDTKKYCFSVILYFTFIFSMLYGIQLGIHKELNEPFHY